MSNITLSIDDETIKQAKLRAVQEGASLSAIMRELLQRYALGQTQDAGPDLSFADNALMFTRQRKRGGSALAPDAKSPPLASNGLSVSPAYLRKIRGWAREDIYDHPTRHGPLPPNRT